MSNKGHRGGKVTLVKSAVWIKSSLSWEYSGVQEEMSPHSQGHCPLHVDKSKFS